jgi:hypothetical protein
MLCAMKRAHHLLAAALLALAASATLSLQAQDTPEGVLSCISNGTKVGHTYLQHSDPAKLKEAVRLFEANAQDANYPEGTVIKAIPQEAMVKRSKAQFPNSNGWEYFALAVTPQSTTVRERGETASNRLGTCQSCHVQGAKFDYVCRSGHGCPSVPLTEEQVTTLQKNDPRCAQ